MTARRTASVLIASTRAATGAYEDQSAPVISKWLTGHGFDTSQSLVVPDGEPVGAALRALLLLDPRVIITSGGTGLSHDDLTPEMTRPLLERKLPGVMQAIRSAGLADTPYAALSRGYAGTAGRTFIVNLPGSPRGVADALAVLDPIIGHICDQLEGSHGH
ncbi:MogA/MoaB family molybdenum cofactor biosynthesis protein [Arthrobacter sp. I2-34]|uniref:MogA/MoaB family molybdenum cofactor biosynthesis protein n=1 Tax=Arthrobacter hankyongi TaxID=2904801 RepID=A0ABS9L1I2_9MICC|nr:MogA/MoaB family molybdenum cofactor biosynthesis protein [Arthrobacter hankyongi]MCG2620362.1 MogA/MoaB family molybdenum cofactor biosynthesis protein [Arthrobacter hankyongi]